MGDNKEQVLQQRTCFIITPIGQENSDIRRHIDGVIDEVICPVLIELNYDIPIVSHREYSTGLIVKSIVRKIVDSDLVIANLTSLNANVMYELSLRHAIGKPVICIAEKGTKLPFDTNEVRTIFYSNDIQGAYELKGFIKKFIESIDYNNAVFENPITNSINAIKIENELLKGNNTIETDKFSYLLEKVENIENTLRSSRKSIVEEMTLTRVPNTMNSYYEAAFDSDNNIRTYSATSSNGFIELKPSIRKSRSKLIKEYENSENS